METYNVKCNGISSSFYVRHESSDRKSVDETWIKKAYYRPSLPFRVLANEKWLDLGANIGAFSVYAALQGANVRAYEPQVDNVNMIKKNAELNNVAVEVFQNAITPDSSHGKLLKFYESTNPKSFRRHTLYGNYLNSARKKTIVETTAKAIGFTSLIKDGYDCLKMNIEGAEIPIITELKSNPGIKKMVFEYSFDMDKRIATYVTVLNKLGTLFEVVKPARKIPLDLEVYPYYPPNCYIFCTNK